MIAIETEQGELIKILKNVVSGDFGFHEQFGFISQSRAEERVATRKRQGFDFTKHAWACRFDLVEDKESKAGFTIKNLDNCEARAIDGGWLLETKAGSYKLVNGQADYVNTLLVDHEDNASWMSRVLELTFLLTFLLIPIIYFMQDTPVEEEVEEEKIVEPLKVQIIKKVKTVNVQRNEVKPNIKVKPLTKAQRSKRAVKRNLGFLGMVGSKTVKDVVGGVPQDLKKATAGAGKGGDAGSGGEVLTNLGKGLKKTTVGNTGVAGLGGKLVTKGTSGGGKGGYGNTLVASGSGTGISAIAVSSSDMVLEGGISRYAINATIAKYLSQVRRCYEERLKVKPGIQGLVQTNFEINPAGKLNYAKVTGATLKDPQVLKCIQKKMMGWQFPKPKGAVKVPVKYPFMLRPMGS
jgi:hypothetical protein